MHKAKTVATPFLSPLKLNARAERPVAAFLAPRAGKNVNAAWLTVGSPRNCFAPGKLVVNCVRYPGRHIILTSFRIDYGVDELRALQDCQAAGDVVES